MPGVVTLSASYGARGDKIGRAVAERLDLPFLGRAVPTAAAAQRLALPEDVVESLDEPAPRLWERIATAFLGADAPLGTVLPSEEVPDTPEQFRASTEAGLREFVDSSGAVVLGRAGMVVLGTRPDVLCVRLDGPVEARIAQVVAEGINEVSARQAQREVDGAREAYARVFFNVRQDDPRLYHVILDSTVLSVEVCVDVVVRAARERLGLTAA